MRVVIDTNIWKKACSKESLSCLMFLTNFLQIDNDQLTIDYCCKIFEEYGDNVEGDLFYQMSIRHLKTQNRISYVSSDIDKRHKEGLDAVGFHEAEDRVFLGCAYNADKYLVTEDSDYGVSPVANKNDELALRKKRYIETEMGVELADSARALKDSLARLK